VKPALLVDAHGLGDSGLARYTQELVRALAAREDFRAIYVAGDPAALRRWLPPSGTRTPLEPLPFTHRRHSLRVPLGWRRLEAQVARPRVSWFPHWDGAWAAEPGVTTIHDLIHLGEPGLVGALKGRVARAWIARMVQGSRALVSGSAYSAGEVAAAFPAAAGKITAIHHGVASAFAAAQPPTVPPVRPYLLTVGNKRAHKRFETAIRAFAQLAGERPELDLLMVGNRDSHAAALRALAARLGVAARVHDRAGLRDAELAATYAGAEALLATSRDEGFGLIAIEAMAAGCPVVAVDRGPFREVLGDAGRLVPYDDPTAMATALRGLARDPQARAALVTRGRARAAQFTWDRAAAALAPVLRAAAH
jgi:glycosyltransferase involved in cell wall biosynthesis